MRNIIMFENFNNVQYRDYKKDEILKYISKYNPSDNNWYRLINGDNVNHKGSLIGKIVNINDQSNIKYEYLYKLEPVTEIDRDAIKYNL